MSPNELKVALFIAIGCGLILGLYRPHFHSSSTFTMFLNKVFHEEPQFSVHFDITYLFHFPNEVR